MKTLYITDLDGTFMNDDAVVSKKSRAIINELSERGLLFSVATSRSIISARDLLKDVNISAPAVFMSGVFIYDFQTEKPVKYFEIDKRNFQLIVNIFESHGKAPFVFFYDENNEFIINFTDLKLECHKQFYKSRKLIMNDRLCKVDKIECHKGHHPLFISLCDTYKDLKPITEEIDMLDNISYSFYKDTYTPYWFLEVFNGEASKAKGLEIVKKHTGADHVVAFGDNLNDIPLFTEADRCYAVSNAVQELKEIATGIIESNNEDGVALFIEENYNEN